MKIQTLEIGNIGTNCYVISDDQAHAPSSTVTAIPSLCSAISKKTA